VRAQTKSAYSASSSWALSSSAASFAIPARLRLITGRPLTIARVPAEELERQAQAAGTDAAIFPSLMLCQTRGDEIAAAPEWLRPQKTVED
jgi:hypothetical protein